MHKGKVHTLDKRKWDNENDVCNSTKTKENKTKTRGMEEKIYIKICLFSC